MLLSCSQAKAEVQCCFCGSLATKGSVVLDFTPYVMLGAHDSDSSLSPVTRRQLASLAPAAAAAPTAAAAAAAAVPTDGIGRTTQPAAGSSSTDAAANTVVLSVSCKAGCGQLYSEQMARWNAGRLYPKYAAGYQGGSSAAGDDAAGAGSSAAAVGAPSAGASNSSNSGNSSALGLLPLPEVDPYPAEDGGGANVVSAAAFWDILEDQKDCFEFSKGKAWIANPH